MTEHLAAGLNPESILAALHKTGFLLEQRALAIAEDGGHNAFGGRLYYDDEGGKYREIDIVTRDHYKIDGPVLHAASLWSCLVGECKNWSDPIAVIGRSKAQTRWHRTFDEVLVAKDPFQHPDLSPTSSLSVALGLRDLPSSVEAVDFIGSQVVPLKKTGKHDAEVSQRGSDVHTSVILPLAKAVRYEQQSLASGAGALTVVACFPTLITSQAVVEVDTSTSKPQVREVPWTTVLRRFGEKRQPTSMMFNIVSESALADFLSLRVRAYSREVAAKLKIVRPILGVTDATEIASWLNSRPAGLTQTDWRYSVEAART